MKDSSTNFSIYEQALTNEKVVITYKPTSTTISYSYKIYKDDSLYDEVKISKNKISNITLEASGKYQIVVTRTEKSGLTTEEKSGYYNIDVDSPYILVKGGNKYIEMHQLKNNQFSVLSLKSYLQVQDIQDGDLFDSLTCNTNGVDFTKVGVSKITCSVVDQAGNKAEAEIILHITKDRSTELNIMLSGILFLGCFLLFLFLRFQRATSLEKKMVKYSVEPIHDKHPSIFEKMADYFYKSIQSINKLLSKSEVLTKYSKKYEKYIPLYSHYNSGMDFVSTKCIISLALVIICLFANTIQYRFIHAYEFILPLAFGFFLPDFIYFLKYKLYRNRLENDLLQAIIIMNNAFKSGRSITQAIELVTKELEGPIGLEFKKMHMEISFGLSIEEVFERFSKRIEMEEVTYLTASLSILNKTGGNIIKVFSSIEKTLFNKKKLKIELQSLTGSSKMLVYVLFAVPFLFVLFINIVSPGYFEPLYTTKIGFILIFIMVLIYLVYIWFVQKIMKVRM
jgi:tight adherence protein B